MERILDKLEIVMSRNRIRSAEVASRLTSYARPGPEGALGHKNDGLSPKSAGPRRY